MANRPVSLLSVVTEEDNPESVDTTSTGTPKPEDTQDGAQSDNNGLLAPMALDKQVFEECSTWDATRLNKCADEARFQYELNAQLDSATGLIL
ncbi:hypothetical protein QL093DRAFT_2098299 [Fusarium oxysporum]|nr:hypothetical protein QL093DRAFT_2098299 [Fusarium oxysporum]